MPGGVGDDKLAAVGIEEAVGHVNGNALLSLCREAVYQQGEVNVATLGAHAFGVAAQAGDLIFKDHLRFIEHAAD